MKVLVIGAHGKVGSKLIKKLKQHRHEVLAMVRDESQKEEIEKKGAKPIVADLEYNIEHAFKEKPDAVIFVAGSGADTGEDKTIAVDLQGARKSIDGCIKHHVNRYLMVSALGVNDADNQPADMRPYFVAKSEADQHLVQSALNYTIFRPGHLIDDHGTGSVEAAEQLDDYGDGKTSRDNLATALVDALPMRNTHKKVVEIVNGHTPIKDALSRI